MFKTSMELKERRIEVHNLKEQVERLQHIVADKERKLEEAYAATDENRRRAKEDYELLARRHELELEYIEKKEFYTREASLADLRKKMQEALITSDVKCAQATASLATYEKMDTKAERTHIQKMLEKAIEGLSHRTGIIIGDKQVA